MKNTKTVEPQYQSHVELRDRIGLMELGIEKNANWYNDPKRFLFVLSRYKFVAKMLSGRKSVLEVGCGDGFPIPIILQEVDNIHAIDIDPVFIDDIKSRINDKWQFTCQVHDILSSPLDEKYDAAYSLDVLEHINKKDEDAFIRNIINSLDNNGILIIGMPSLESQSYASPLSKIGHVNCKTGRELKCFLLKYFHNVFIFSMNDEVIHTGYLPMSQYLFALCTSKLP